MTHPSRRIWTTSLSILAILGLLTGMLLPLSQMNKAQAATPKAGSTPPYVKGPFVDPPSFPTVFNGDLRDLPQTPLTPHEIPAPRAIKQANPANGNPGAWVDPVAQQSSPQQQMPDPIANFAGLDFQGFGGGWPPDTNGDVGPTYYIQTVNTSVGIFDKSSGARVVGLSFDDFFQGPVGSVCDNQNAGDPIALYDPQVDRWIVTDFAWVNFNTGPFYECIAVSQSGDPVSGGWYFYAMRADTGSLVGYLNDYPKLGVWSDGWYMSANMFGTGFAVRLWALDRVSALIGGPLHEQYFDCTDPNYCASLLPANVRGTLPPDGSPEYFANVVTPNLLNIWQFHVDWTTPGNSTFTGPTSLTIADFQGGIEVPQKAPGEIVDSLGDRMMFQLQYRNLDGVEALYANHTVYTNGVNAIRWYEVRDPGGTPVLFQQGTYQPDQNYRWMGSIAADQDGNIAAGYSVSSSSMYPAIRYAGRLAGETPGFLTQGEAVLVQGTGAQSGGYGRWGDYSAMSVDPTDDCTFWYTQEYYLNNGSNWQTRIGSFKFPSCGAPKGTLEGHVYDSLTNLPLAGVPVVATDGSLTVSFVTDGTGFFSINLMAGTYNVTAGPSLPGYPGTDVANGLIVVANEATQHDFQLAPAPSLVDAGAQVNDSVPNGNGNGFPEPGEQGMLLSESLLNQGAITSTQITAKVSSLTAGVTINTADSTYPDIPVGLSETNTTPYVFSIDPSVLCGIDMSFQALITDSITSHTTNFNLTTGVPQPLEPFYSNDVEGGAAGWTTGGTPNSWTMTTSSSHSPSHSWTDSVGNYQNDANNWVRTQTLDLTQRKHVQVSAWFKYALEAGYDYAFVEYSLDGGATWNPTPLATFNGFQSSWQQVTMDAPMLDNQANVALRFRLKSDGGVVYDGIYVDDVTLSYQPYVCNYTPVPNAPTLVSPADSTWVNSPVTFVWQPADSGVPAEGYIFYLDDSPVVTFTTPITSTTLEVTPWAHTWFVKATTPTGVSLPSTTWSFDVLGKFFLPLAQK
jgi:hypothetical protein